MTGFWLASPDDGPVPVRAWFYVNAAAEFVEPRVSILETPQGYSLESYRRREGGGSDLDHHSVHATLEDAKAHAAEHLLRGDGSEEG